MLSSPWLPGHDFALYENGEAFFPAALRAIARARREILIETFIWGDDEAGRPLLAALIDAARRGVEVVVCADGYGSPDVTPEFLGELKAAGGRVYLFDPQPAVMGVRTHLIRRLHRKIVVVDGEVAFVGGINFEAEQLMDLFPHSKRDYAMRVTGPVVAEIHAFCRSFVAGRQVPMEYPRWWHRWIRRFSRSWTAPVPPEGSGVARFVYRDNQRHRADIEFMYRAWLRAAKDEVIIANAYFFPGYRLLRQLRRAAQRGVRVRLIFQGMPDMKSAQLAAQTLYQSLIAAGVEVYEYVERPLHAKVAVFDGQWATVGSSNLDPLSLSLNLESNLFVSDRRFAQDLRARLEHLLDQHCQQVLPEHAQAPRWWRRVYQVAAFHLVRRFPLWARNLGARRRQRLQAC